MLADTIPRLTSILVWRFMIDLQDANQSHVKIDSDDPLYFTTQSGGSLSFARAIGSIGAVLTSNVIKSQDEHERTGSSEFEQHWPEVIDINGIYEDSKEGQLRTA